MIPNFRWPEPEDESDERLISNVKTYGCHIMSIFAKEGEPGWAFSIGYYVNYGHPEVIVFGLRQRTAGVILNDICGRLVKGERFAAGDRNNELIQDHDVTFLEVAYDQYPDHLGYAIWFYRSLGRPFPALQLVWPDRRGKFPWEGDHDKSLLRLQPLLTTLT